MTDAVAGRRAWGYGLATVADDGTVLDTWFPAPRLGARPASDDPEDAPTGTGDPRLGARPASDDPQDAPTGLDEFAGPDARRGVSIEIRTVEVDLDADIASTPDAYLRLHLLSHLLVRPNEIGLDGLFGQLPIVAWTTAGPMLPRELDRRRPVLQRAGISVLGVDRFPRMLDYVVPDRVRIADASRVRLGAHLAPGTTVMHEGFVNYNAGTLGASMVEGRISQGVVVGDGSDIGGGASIMGTLSGGGTVQVRIGARSLLGANAGVGIPIGDDCVVEAGLYVTAGTKVTLRQAGAQPSVVKAAVLSDVQGLLFRRNSQTGAVEALPREGHGVELNAALHA